MAAQYRTTRKAGNVLRAISRAIEKFCAKHRGFGIPRLMTYIVFISAAAFVIELMNTTETSFFHLLAFSPRRILGGEVWRLVTWVFTPSNPQMLFMIIALYFYYFIGSTLEREWGTPKFSVFYIFGVTVNIIYGFLFWYITGRTLDIVSLSPLYLNLSMFFAFAAIFPEQRVFLFFFIPVKIKWLAIVNAFFFGYNIVMGLLNGLRLLSPSAIFFALLPLVALLNFILICGHDLLMRIRPYKSRVAPGTIRFKHAAKKARREYDGKPYRHKCAVCGKTDAEFPGLEFRYCSRCNGYHCFCTDHINNHVHFQ